MILTAVPYFHLTHLRIYGVLTRIALCYLAGGLILLTTRNLRVLAAITAMPSSPPTGPCCASSPFPAMASPPTTSLSSTRTAISPHGSTAPSPPSSSAPSTPASSTSTPATPKASSPPSPAIATVLIGAMAGLYLRQHFARPVPKTRNGLFLAGLACFAALEPSGPAGSPSTKTSGPAPTSSCPLAGPSPPWASSSTSSTTKRLHDTTASGRFLTRPSPHLRLQRHHRLRRLGRHR